MVGRRVIVVDFPKNKTKQEETKAAALRAFVRSNDGRYMWSMRVRSVKIEFETERRIK